VVASKLTKTTFLNLEEVLVSKSRIKILRALAIGGLLNISEIKKRTGLNYRSIIKALEVLKQMRIVGEVDLNRSRNFRIKAENLEASAVEELIKTLDDLQPDSRQNISTKVHQHN
jgi:predicted transcriptional regulator